MTTHVLVAGATGDLGSRIMRELLLRDTHIRVLTRPGSGKAQAMYGNNNRMEIVEVHYSDQSALSTAHLDVETVISSATGSLPPDIARTMSDLSGTPYNLLWAGTTNVLPAISKVAQRFWKDPLATFPAWQGMQYFMSTFSGQSQLRHVENNRYGKHPWTTVKDVLAQHGLDNANQH